MEENSKFQRIKQAIQVAKTPLLEVKEELKRRVILLSEAKLGFQKKGILIGSWVAYTSPQTIRKENSEELQVLVKSKKYAKTKVLVPFATVSITIERYEIIATIAGDREATLLYGYIEANFEGSSFSVRLNVEELSDLFQCEPIKVINARHLLVKCDFIEEALHTLEKDIYVVNYHILSKGNLGGNPNVGNKTVINMDAVESKFHRNQMHQKTGEIFTKALKNVQEKTPPEPPNRVLPPLPF